MPQRRRPAALAALTLFSFLAATSPAQAQDTLTEILSFLLTNQLIPTGELEKDMQAARVTSDTVTQLLLVELSNVPISSSASGFVYRFDAALGTMTRASDSFGPFFTERSLTSGRGQLSFGATVQSAQYTTLDGRDLRDGQLVAGGRQFRDEPAPFDLETLTLDLESRTITLFANAGLTDRLDLGVALPIVTLSLEGSRINTYRGETLLQARATADATGVADVAVRAKYRLLGDADRGLAVVGEVRLPTGRDEDLLGAGRTSWRGVVIGSLQSGRLAVHGNFGATAGGLVSELQYRGAATAAASSRVTIVGEIIGRRVSDVGHITLARGPHPTIAGADTLRLVSEPGSTSTASLVTGVKWNLGGTWLVSGNVLWPITDSGLKSRPVVVVGADWALGR
jgi:hypothetical protein